MERESFEDEEVAAYLNAYFVSVKVDREERPDVDHIYMTACQAFTGAGGWPLTVVTTANGNPLFAGTYFPKRPRLGQPGLLDVLAVIQKRWQRDRTEVEDIGRRMLEQIRPHMAMTSLGEISMEVVLEAIDQLAAEYDSTFGGFGEAPKFPTAQRLLFLLRAGKQFGRPDLMHMALHTLDSMANGGLWDHVGFGWSRYSTDRQWLVPHFEKMLYDNSMLAFVCGEAYAATGEWRYRQLAEDTLTYLLRDMRDDEGGFHSAEDADSQGEEGRYYLWTPAQVAEVLGEIDGAQFCRWYGIRSGGNFEGRSIPNRIEADGNGDSGICHDPVVNASRVREWRARLLTHRLTRVRPHKDDKVLTSWNGLAMAAFATCGRRFGSADLLQVAREVAIFIDQKMIDKDGNLFARYRQGDVHIRAYLDDYAYLVWGLIELYEATFEARWLDSALKLSRRMIAQFRDADTGAFFMTADQADTSSGQLIARPMEAYDGALPSGNSAAAHNLLRLSRLTGDVGLAQAADSLLRAFAGVVARHPPGYTHYLSAVMEVLSGESMEVVVVGDRSAETTKRAIDVVHSMWIPQATLLFRDVTDSVAIDDLAPYARNCLLNGDGPTFYVCRNFACGVPTNDLAAFQKSLLT